MCTIFIAWQCDAERPLVLLTNRDEFHNRPSSPAILDEASGILAGKDLRAGGRWAGINASSGRFAAVTNIREPHIAAPESAPSRGRLVEDFLSENCSLDDFNCKLTDDAGKYAGFNLIFGDRSELHYFSNRHGHQRLKPGFYGLSNAALDTPWPKVTNGGTAFQQAFANNARASEYFSLMQSTQIANDENLPDTGVGLALERMLSALFIMSPVYGTQCTTLIELHQQRLQLQELRYAPDGSVL